MVERLAGTDSILVADETGDLRKGVCTVGVQRPYPGTTGRIENAQVAAYPTYSTAMGHAFIDRELYYRGLGQTIPDDECALMSRPRSTSRSDQLWPRG